MFGSSLNLHLSFLSQKFEPYLESNHVHHAMSHPYNHPALPHSVITSPPTATFRIVALNLTDQNVREIIQLLFPAYVGELMSLFVQL